MYMRINLEDVHTFGVRVTQLKRHRKSSKFEKSGYYYNDIYMGSNFHAALNELMYYTLFSEGKWDSLKKELNAALQKINKQQQKKTEH